MASYTVELANVYVPDDITESIKLECVCYDSDTQIFRENVVYDNDMTDDVITTFLRDWAKNYVDRQEKSKQSELLTILQKKLSYSVKEEVIPIG